MKKKEAVNHPAHYGGDVLHEVWKCLQAWGLDKKAYAWNAVKYIARAGVKDPSREDEDLKKARWYLDREIARVERERVAARLRPGDGRRKYHRRRNRGRTAYSKSLERTAKALGVIRPGRRIRANK